MILRWCFGRRITWQAGPFICLSTLQFPFRIRDFFRVLRSVGVVIGFGFATSGTDDVVVLLLHCCVCCNSTETGGSFALDEVGAEAVSSASHSCKSSSLNWKLGPKTIWNSNSNFQTNC